MAGPARRPSPRRHPTTTTAAGATGQQSAFRDCLQKHGVTLPAGFGEWRPARWRPARRWPACRRDARFAAVGLVAGRRGSTEVAERDRRRAAALAGGERLPGRGGANSQALQAYMSCLSDHGVTVPTSDFRFDSGRAGCGARRGARRSEVRGGEQDLSAAAAGLRNYHDHARGDQRTDEQTTAYSTVCSRWLSSRSRSGAFVTVRSSSSTAATTQTFATAKRGVVLQSVTSTGNVEALDRSVALVPAVGRGHRDLRRGRRSRGAEPTGAREGRRHPAEDRARVGEASLASAQANLAGLERGETAIERQADDASAASAAQSVTTAQLGLTHAQQNATNNVDEVSAGDRSVAAIARQRPTRAWRPRKPS